MRALLVLFTLLRYSLSRSGPLWRWPLGLLSTLSYYLSYYWSYLVILLVILLVIPCHTTHGPQDLRCSALGASAAGPGLRPGPARARNDSRKDSPTGPEGPEGLAHGPGRTRRTAVIAAALDRGSSHGEAPTCTRSIRVTGGGRIACRQTGQASWRGGVIWCRLADTDTRRGRRHPGTHRGPRTPAGAAGTHERA